MKKLDGCLRAIDSLSEISGKVFSWLLVALTLVVIYEVIARYLFGRPTSWAFEISWILCGSLLVMLLAWTHKEGGHIEVDVIYRRFPLRVRLILRLVFFLVLCLPWVTAVVIGGFEFAQKSWVIQEHTMSPFRPPIYPLKMMIPIGFGLLWLQCLAKFIRDLRTLLKGGGINGI